MDFISLPTSVLFCPMNQSRIPHCIQFSCLHIFSQSVIVPWSLFVIQDCDTFEEYWKDIFQSVLQFDLSSVFSWIFNLLIFGRGPRNEDPFLVYCIRGAWSQICLVVGDAHLDHLAKVVFARSFCFVIIITVYLFVYIMGNNLRPGK